MRPQHSCVFTCVFQLLNARIACVCRFAHSRGVGLHYVHAGTHSTVCVATEVLMQAHTRVCACATRTCANMRNLFCMCLSARSKRGECARPAYFQVAHSSGDVLTKQNNASAPPPDVALPQQCRTSLYTLECICVQTHTLTRSCSHTTHSKVPSVFLTNYSHLLALNQEFNRLGQTLQTFGAKTCQRSNMLSTGVLFFLCCMFTVSHGDVCCLMFRQMTPIYIIHQYGPWGHQIAE